MSLNRAGGRHPHDIDFVGSTRWASGKHPIGKAGHDVGQRRLVSSLLVVGNCPLGFGLVNDTQITNADFSLFTFPLLIGVHRLGGRVILLW
mgnify:CR=1 FL=1